MFAIRCVVGEIVGLFDYHRKGGYLLCLGMPGLNRRSIIGPVWATRMRMRRWGCLGGSILDPGGVRRGSGCLCVG